MKKAVWILALAFSFWEQGFPQTSGSGIWISRGELAGLPTSGSAWNNLKEAADQSCGSVDLRDQDQRNNVCILAKALVFARTGQNSYLNGVIAALESIVNMGAYQGRALALGRELGAYVVAADLVDLEIAHPGLDNLFRVKIKALLTAPTIDGPSNLIDCHEDRPNNWGTHCGGARAAVAAYLGDSAELARVAQVFKGWLGDRSSYAGFRYGDPSWSCDTSTPQGINPRGCTRNGHSIDGVLPDDQRRSGDFTWPPPQENYVYEALQGALMQAVILKRAGYDAFGWQDQALLRAFQWLHNEANFPAEGDDAWQPHVLNHYYGTSFPAQVPARPGKNMGWTDWTHSSMAVADTTPPAPRRITVGTVVNGANFVPGPLAPGSIAAAFGSGFASAPAEEVVLRMNGIAAPLLHVSEEQINFQVPWELAGLPEASVTVSAPDSASDPVPVQLAPASPALFSLDQSGTGQGTIVIADSPVFAASATGSLSARPANRGEFISIYCTGLGQVLHPPATGMAASADPVSETATLPTVTIGGVPATVAFSGLSPGYLGLYQVNVQVPGNAPAGDALPVVVSIGGATSNTVTIAVRQ